MVSENNTKLNNNRTNASVFSKFLLGFWLALSFGFLPTTSIGEPINKSPKSEASSSEVVGNQPKKQPNLVIGGFIEELEEEGSEDEQDSVCYTIICRYNLKQNLSGNHLRTSVQALPLTPKPIPIFIRQHSWRIHLI